jgi:hypothetical protein
MELPEVARSDTSRNDYEGTVIATQKSAQYRRIDRMLRAADYIESSSRDIADRESKHCHRSDEG